MNWVKTRSWHLQPPKPSNPPGNEAQKKSLQPCRNPSTLNYCGTGGSRVLRPETRSRRSRRPKLGGLRHRLTSRTLSVQGLGLGLLGFRSSSSIEGRLHRSGKFVVEAVEEQSKVCRCHVVGAKLLEVRGGRRTSSLVFALRRIPNRNVRE